MATVIKWHFDGDIDTSIIENDRMTGVTTVTTLEPAKGERSSRPRAATRVLGLANDQRTGIDTPRAGELDSKAFQTEWSNRFIFERM
jgi:hypothetical protein